jgi:hypothetical protein
MDFGISNSNGIVNMGSECLYKWAFRVGFLFISWKFKVGYWDNCNKSFEGYIQLTTFEITFFTCQNLWDCRNLREDLL